MVLGTRWVTLCCARRSQLHFKWNLEQFVHAQTLRVVDDVVVHAVFVLSATSVGPARVLSV